MQKTTCTNTKYKQAQTIQFSSVTCLFTSNSTTDTQMTCTELLIDLKLNKHFYFKFKNVKKDLFFLFILPVLVIVDDICDLSCIVKNWINFNLQNWICKKRFADYRNLHLIISHRHFFSHAISKGRAIFSHEEVY